VPVAATVLLEYVDVTEVTCETVMVLVSVAVEVIVVVREVVSAMASRGRRRAVASDEKRILDVKCVRGNEGSM
jgi:hypothetical protein